MRKKKVRPRGTGTLFRPKQSRFWWIAYVSGGVRRFESTEKLTKGEAQQVLTDRLGDINKGIAVTPQMGRLTLKAGLDAVIVDLKNNGHDSQHAERRIAKHLLRLFAPDIRMTTINTAAVEAYKQKRLGEAAKPATVNRELSVLKRAYRLSELITKPTIKLLTEHNTRKGFFEREAFEAVKAQLPVELRPVVEFMYLTGWRKSEVLTLTTDRVDMKAGTVRLEPGETKNRDGRTVYLIPVLRDVLAPQLADLDRLKAAGMISPFVFHRADGSQIKDFRSAWQTATVKAGHLGKLLHDFRRSAVRNLERAGVPRSEAMAITGHKTESVYRRYAIRDEASGRAAADTYSAFLEAQRQHAPVEVPTVKTFKRER